MNSNLPFLKFFLPFLVFVLLCGEGTICESDAMRTAGYNHLISRNYNKSWFGLLDSPKSKTSISYWPVCPTNWSTGHFWIMHKLALIKLLELHGGIFPLCALFLNHFPTPQLAACNLHYSFSKEIVEVVSHHWWHRYVGDRFQMLVAESLCWLYLSLC